MASSSVKLVLDGIIRFSHMANITSKKSTLRSGTLTSSRFFQLQATRNGLNFANHTAWSNKVLQSSTRAWSPNGIKRASPTEPMECHTMLPNQHQHITRVREQTTLIGMSKRLARGSLNSSMTFSNESNQFFISCKAFRKEAQSSDCQSD